jgi:hypothetical protein
MENHKDEVKLIIKSGLPFFSSEQEAEQFKDHSVEWHEDGSATVRDAQGNVVKESHPEEITIPITMGMGADTGEVEVDIDILRMTDEEFAAAVNKLPAGSIKELILKIRKGKHEAKQEEDEV